MNVSFRSNHINHCVICLFFDFLFSSPYSCSLLWFLQNGYHDISIHFLIINVCATKVLLGDTQHILIHKSNPRMYLHVSFSICYCLHCIGTHILVKISGHLLLFSSSVSNLWLDIFLNDFSVFFSFCNFLLS